VADNGGRIVFDCETDGLLTEATKVHSLVLRDADTGKGILNCAHDAAYADIERGLDMLSTASCIIGHNSIGYDVPVLEKLYPRWVPPKDHIDTFISASFLHAHIAESDMALWRRKRLPGEFIGRHSLEAWGHRLRLHKGSFTPPDEANKWATWTPEMQVYCVQDTRVTWTLFQKIVAPGIAEFPLAAEIEHKLAHYLSAQTRNGFPVNADKLASLYAQLAAKRDATRKVLGEVFPPGTVEEVFIPKRNNRTRGYVEGVPFIKRKVVEFNPTSRPHIAHRLNQRYGWEPADFTTTGEPQIDDDILRAMAYPEAALLADNFETEKLIGMSAEGNKAWLKFLTSKEYQGGKLTGMEHIHGRINQNGAVTHRGTHSSPNMGQVPKMGTTYGADCRGLFVAPRGWRLLGADAAGLELRCLAHFMARYDGGAYGLTVVHGKSEDGTDVHSVNRDALGLSGKAGRDAAKTFIYAYLYGAGDAKLGSILEPLSSEASQKKIGKELRKKFEQGLPALGLLTKGVKARAKKIGYLYLPDGRKAYVRHQHAALNTLLQGTGAIICKSWIVDYAEAMHRSFGSQGWKGKWAACAWVHDEIQVAVRPDIADLATQFAISTIQKQTERFSFRCPLDGSASLGQSWADTH
jgi:DNA polymerase I-like protein with 3'-5' exonuclease and polymerase domains